MNFSQEIFKEFIEPQCNRKDFIISVLKQNGVDAVVMPVEGKNHIHVIFPSSAYNPSFKIKTVIAHYDRFQGSPGANDNSAAVFMMLQWAVHLASSVQVHNIRLIFTDGEEMGSGGVSEQGAFGLASIFNRLNIKNDDIFVFDCMGRGTIPVLAKSVLPAKCSSKFRKAFFELHDRAANILASASGKFVTLPVSYSDNAGFLAFGLPVVAVTMLTDEEASKLMFDLVKNQKLESYIMNNTKDFTDEELEQCEKLIPETWKKFHTQEDNLESLQSESFSITSKILFQLERNLTPC